MQDIFIVIHFFNYPIEMIPDYNYQWSIEKKFEGLVKSIEKKAEKSGKRCAVLIDEFPPLFFEICPNYHRFLCDLQAQCPLVYIFLAISPSGRNLNQSIAKTCLKKTDISTTNFTILAKWRNSLTILDLSTLVLKSSVT